MIAAIAAQQVTVLRRKHVLTVAFATMIGITVLAGVLGWASRLTIIGVYDESVKLLASRGGSAPPNPFLLKPVLSLMSNMVIYVTMIGALVALLLGHLTLAEDFTVGIAALLFSRPVTRTQYALGKLAAAMGTLGAAMAACAVVSVGALVVVNRRFPSAGDLSRLVVFHALSWLYLSVFALVGMVTLLVARRRALGLLCAIGVWLMVTFVAPQFTSGLRPSQSLNPIVDPISTSQTFFRLTSKGRPFSVAEQFKQASAHILHTGPSEPIWTTVERTAPIIGLMLVLSVLVVGLVRRHDFVRSDARE